MLQPRRPFQDIIPSKMSTSQCPERTHFRVLYPTPAMAAPSRTHHSDEAELVSLCYPYSGQNLPG